MFCMKRSTARADTIERRVYVSPMPRYGDEVDLEAEDESTVRHCPQYDNTARPQTAASLWIFTDEETGEVMIANSDFLSQRN